MRRTRQETFPHTQRALPTPDVLRRSYQVDVGLSLLLPDYVNRDLHRRHRSSVLKPVCGVPILGPAHSRPIVRSDSISMVSDRSLQDVDDAWSVSMVVNRAETPPGSIVTIRIRSWRPAMPSISGPRSTVASNCAVTPFVSGAARSLLIVLSSLVLPGPNDRPNAGSSLSGLPLPSAQEQAGDARFEMHGRKPAGPRSLHSSRSFRNAGASEYPRPSRCLTGHR